MYNNLYLLIIYRWWFFYTIRCIGNLHEGVHIRIFKNEHRVFWVLFLPAFNELSPNRLG